MIANNLLISSILQIVQLTDEEQSAASSFFKNDTMEKGDYFLREGQICNKVGFIISGCMIYSNHTEEGEEIPCDFAFEGEWVTQNESKNMRTPSKISIKAWERTEITIISQNDLLGLFDKIPKLERVARVLAEQSFISMAQRNEDFQILTAEQRYIKLMQEKPQILKRIPLYSIASFLGINPKSLSRIRKEIMEKG